MKKQSNSNFEIDIADILSNKRTVKSDLVFDDHNRGRIIHFYICDEIERSEKYATWFDTIRNCTADDIIHFHFNSMGGDLFTAIQFLQAFSECEGTIVGSVEGACFSAATLIFLACDMYKLSPYASLMIHNYSGGTFGKGGEMMDQLTFESKWAETLFKDAYRDFLSSEEITSILKGQDLWMSADQCLARLDNRQSIRDRKSARAEDAICI